MPAPTADGDHPAADLDPSPSSVVAAGERGPAIEALDRLARTLEATQRMLDVFVDEVREHGRA